MTPGKIEYVYNNKVIMSNNNAPICFSIDSNKQLWYYPLDEIDEATKKPVFFANDYYLQFLGDTMFYIQDEHGAPEVEGCSLHIVDINTGKAIKKLADDGFNADNYFLDDHIAYLSYSTGVQTHDEINSVLASPHIVKFDMKTLKQIWDKPTKLTFSGDNMPGFGGMLVADKNVYFVVDSALIVFDKNNCSKNIATIKASAFISDIEQTKNLLFVNSVDLWDTAATYRNIILDKTQLKKVP